MGKTLRWFFLLASFVCVSRGQHSSAGRTRPTALANANDVLTSSLSRAAAENKEVLMVFGESWSTFCRPLESFLDSPEIRPIINKYLVRANLSVDEEAGGKPYLNNPGAEDVWIKAGGRRGLPFIVIYDRRGKPIVTSNRQPLGVNIGYPAKPLEIDWFVEMLKMSAPSISEGELETVHAWLTSRGHN